MEEERIGSAAPGGGYDLHTHSTRSDGTTPPAEIAREAAAVGLEGFALTDHDTIDGWGEARQGAAEAGVDFIPGMEITTRDAGRSVHLLAYGFDPLRGELLHRVGAVRVARLTRAREIVRLLSRDYRIAWEEVIGDGDERTTVGRPHIADALVAQGYYASRSEVFADALHPSSPYYLDTEAIDTTEAIRMVREAGGVAVLAHPAAMRQRRPISTEAIERFAAAGLWGVELDHPENREDWLPDLRRGAAALGLRSTGASDYHGAGKPNTLGERRSDLAVVTAIRSLAVTRR